MNNYIDNKNTFLGFININLQLINNEFNFKSQNKL